MANETVYQFNSKIEFVTGSRKYRTRAQWPVTIRYQVDSDEVKITTVLWDKCNGEAQVDITEFILSHQIKGLQDEIQELFWKDSRRST